MARRPASSLAVATSSNEVNANPLKRALRLDKLALALLDATLKAYEDDEAAAQIPLLRNLGVSMDELERRASKVAKALKNKKDAQIETCYQ